jgi:phage-related minor tail protein
MQEAGYDTTGNQSFIAAMLARAESVASRVDALTPVNYAADSLNLLGQIDSTLAALEAGSKSAERIISDAINVGRDATVGGLRQILNAMTGRGVSYFANGGAFTNGIASSPTAFDMGVMGESGPEAIMPLTNVGGRLGVRASGDGNAEMATELRAIREELSKLRAETRSGQAANAGNTGKMLKIMDREYIEGKLVRTDADQPLSTVAA